MTSPQIGVPQARRFDAALFILRVASALAFLYHGSAILFGAFGGPGPEQFASSHHWPVSIGYLVGLAQFGGGLAVLSGVLFRVGAACIIAVMLGAIFWFIFRTASILGTAERNMHSRNCCWR